MTTFVDTSALFAYLDGEDSNHRAARRVMPDLVRERLVTHNYITVESVALAQRRLGPSAVRTLLDDIAPLLETIWVGAEIHNAAAAALLAAVRRRTSLVDWVSFEVMRREGIRRAFAFDRDFSAQGFETLP